VTDPLETRIAQVLAEDIVTLPANTIGGKFQRERVATLAAEIARALGAETRVEWGFRHPGWPTIDIGPHVETSYTGHDGWTTGPYDAETARQFANGRPVVIRTVTTVPPLVGDWQETDS